MYKEVHRGDIWFVDWSPGRGSEQAGMRPAVIIQTDAANRNPHYPNTIVLTISTKGKAVPFHVPVNPSEENGLQETSFVKCDSLKYPFRPALLMQIEKYFDRIHKVWQ